MPHPASPSLVQEVGIALALIALFWLPGAALLKLAGLRSRWPLIPQVIITIGLSIAIIPVLFYSLRFWLPNVTVDSISVGISLLVCSLYLYSSTLLNRDKTSRPFVQKLEKTDWALVLIAVLTLLTRVWIAHLHPIPAWTDSFHHTLITELTVEKGQIPTDLEPYFSIPLSMYHLGLHAIAACVVWLTGAASHVALQWTAQALNGLSGLGVYLVLEKSTGNRIGALLGTATVGLLCHMPAYYVNWGRFTQIASQSILLIGWFVIVEAIRPWTHSKDTSNIDNQVFSWRHQLGIGIVASVLIAAIFLLHFRVAALFVLLLVVTLPRNLWLAYCNEKFWPAFLYLISIGTLAMLFVLPALWGAIETYIAFRQAAPIVAKPQGNSQVNDSYYLFPLSTIPTLVARSWLLALAGISIVIGLWNRHWLTITMVLWTILLIGLGNTYRLGIPMLNVTNLGMVLIMLYLPMSIVIGVAFGWGLSNLRAIVPSQYHLTISSLLIGLLIVGSGIAGWQRIQEIEDPRFMVTTDDLKAMEWIKENTQPEDTFGVNAGFWRPAALHGEDGGYWIPYFTQRKTTAPPMLMFLAAKQERLEMIETARAVLAFEESPASVEKLRERGIDYIYIGSPTVNHDQGLSRMAADQSQQLEVVFQSNGVEIYQILAP